MSFSNPLTTPSTSMETQQQERREKGETDIEGKERNLAEKPQATEGAAAAVNSPVPSETSSPSHEFSFTVSLNSSTTLTTSSSSSSTTTTTTRTKTVFQDKTKQQQQHQPPLAIDLSPADDIFFHGHLLPLHFLSHLQASSPRSSTNSLDSFTLPIREIFPEEKHIKEANNITACNCEDDNHDQTHEANIGTFGLKRRDIKIKPFSLFGLGKWRKGSDAKERSDERNNDQQQHKRKLKFDVSQFLKRYLRMVKPLLSAKGGRSREDIRVRRQSYSFSGYLSPRDHKRELRGRRGEVSAPASMRTSPTNSGLLLATAGVPSPASDSTMEELHAAIQAAIAHCKNSISAEGKSQEISVQVN